jgi:tRNA threonylcarbamoyladenosine biosynthesis protein TsaE
MRHRDPMEGEKPITWESHSAVSTEAFGASLGHQCRGGEVIALIGELGTGKTCLVRGIARGLGVSQDNVASPTFALIHEYTGRMPLVHVDLYRLEADDATNRLGLEEYLESPSVVAIEWADKARLLLPRNHLRIEIAHRGGDHRRFSLSASGQRYQTLIEQALCTLL